MKRVSVVKMNDVEVQPFVLENFAKAEKSHSQFKKVTKKELKNLAEGLGMQYTEEKIEFTKKLITAYLRTYSEKR